MNRSRFHFALDLAAIAVAGFSLFAPPAGAARPESPLTISPLALHETYPQERDLVVAIVQGVVTAAGNGAFGLAGVHLPDGAELTALSVFAFDDNASSDLELRIYRRRISAGLLDGQEMALVQTSGSTGAVLALRDESIAFPVIENAAYIYWLAARMRPSTGLVGIQIEFLAPLLVDGFESGGTAAWTPGGQEPGFTSPYVVHFADAVSTTLGDDGCFSGGDTGFSSEGYLRGGFGDGLECCFVAPVHLPDGVSVTGVLSYVLDAGSADLTLSLRRKSLANQVVTTAMATTATSGSGNNVRLFSDGTIVDPVIDNDSYAYFLSSDTCLDPDLDLSFYQTLVFYDE